MNVLCFARKWRKRGGAVKWKSDDRKSDDLLVIELDDVTLYLSCYHLIE